MSCRVTQEKINKSLSYNFGCLANILSCFCLTQRRLCDCDIEEKGLLLLCIVKWLCRETIDWKFLHFFVLNTEWVRSQTLSISHNRLRIKKSIDDGEGVNRRTVSDRKTVVDRDSLRNAIRSSTRTANIQGNLELKRQLCDELSRCLEPSPVSLWNHWSRLNPRQAPWTLSDAR